MIMKVNIIPSVTGADPEGGSKGSGPPFFYNTYPKKKIKKIKKKLKKKKNNNNNNNNHNNQKIYIYTKNKQKINQ